MCDGVKEMKLRAKGRPLLALPMAALAEQWAHSHSGPQPETQGSIDEEETR